MRIRCPNCSAEYEVADDVIPAAGRDVQCSACGHTWLARPPGAEAPAPRPAAPPPAVAVDDDDARAVARAVAIPGTPSAPDAPPAPDAVPAARAEDEADDTWDDEAPAEPQPAPAAPPAPPRPALSPEVAAILREEAEREQAARRAERRPAPPPIEEQPDLGLDATVDPDIRRAEEARRRMARLRGEVAPPTAAPVRPPDDPPRARERLPDIDEINSSLRAATERAPAGALAEPETGSGGRGFRLGFSVVLLAAAAATLLYVFAGQLGQAVPALAPILDRYVAAVDDGRLWLDLTVQGLIAQEGAQAPVLSDAPPPAAVTEAPAAPAAPAGQ